ncbi:Crp/Fnr family transcriptional regulator [Flavobacterium gyeonganense]|uniref:Crp/Fnr family transcriptional regulator n=1 Tax=Flavobacterium gyeonganense TaxID=1310418 RepID=UPI00241466FA|nr:cyclic nucleotide-binding domain-containing protein [Flavobacterium gyeonganense]
MENENKKSFLGSLGLSEKELQELANISQHKIIQKGNYFISEGQIPRKMAFVIKGLFRYVYTHENGNEFTKNIIAENNFVSSYSAMICNTPSYFAVEAMENSEILEIDYADWLDIKEKNPFWNAFLVQILEKAFTLKKKEKENYCFWMQKKDTRFLLRNF